MAASVSGWAVRGGGRFTTAPCLREVVVATRTDKDVGNSEDERVLCPSLAQLRKGRAFRRKRDELGEAGMLLC